MGYKKVLLLALLIIVLLAVGYFAWNEREAAPARDVMLETTFPRERTVQLFFYDPNRDMDQEGNVMCSNKGLVPVTRNLASVTPIEDTLRLLLAGNLTPVERAQGITTEYPLPGVTLSSVALSQDGTLRIEFTDPQHSLSGGSCRTAVLAAQVTETAMQFPGVSSVEFLPEDVFQP